MPGTLKPVTDVFRRQAASLQYFPRAFALTWQAAPRWTLAWITLLGVQSLLPVAMVLLSRTLVDQAAQYIQDKPGLNGISSLAATAGGIAVILLLTELLRGATSIVRVAQAERLRDHITSLVQRQSARLDLAFYDSADYYDRLHRARWESSSRPIALLENTGALLQNGITLVGMAAILLPYGAWLPLLLLGSTLPALFVVIRYNQQLHAFQHSITASERRASYYDWLLADRGFAAEVRLFALGDHFQRLYQALREGLRGKKLKMARQQVFYGLAAAGIGLLATGLALGWMGWQMVLGLVTLGDLALFYQAFQRGQGLLRSLLENAGQVYANSLFLGDLFEFLALEPKIKDPADPLAVPAIQTGLRLEKVCFAYPGSRRPVLEDLSLEIPAGKIVAIVGPNGVGKSTLIKLLCRLYDPDQGQILLDGIDLRCFSLEALRRSITVLFQEPAHYQDTAAGNIRLGNLCSTLTDQDIRAAAEAAGAEELISRLPQGYENLLGSWFAGGVDLSVGEWQRLALARAFLRRAPLMILDEPTSALDPWSEADWMGRFRCLASGQTAVLITHRLTTAARADLIYVMQSGQIIESGSHAELLASGGLYARSWNSQMSGLTAAESL